MLWGIISFVISLILRVVSYLLRPKPKPPKGATPGTEDDLGIPQVEEGRNIPVVFGTRWVTPTGAWYGHFHISPIIKKVKGGKK